MIERKRHLKTLTGRLKQDPVVAILGPRQAGKTTLAAQFAAHWPGPSERFDLEDSADLARLADPMLALRPLKGLVILDEVQCLPEVFRTLRVLADRKPCPARFLVLGSASPGLLRQTSETLAGRIHYHDLGGLAVDEIEPARQGRLWLRGGFPSSFLASSERQSMEWRRDFIRTFLERDMPSLGVRVPAPTLRRFWTMLAHWHGGVWNASAFGRSLGTADTTIRHYLDTLAAGLVVRVLPPWHENIRKRHVKSPKVYIADSGLLHSLLNLATQRDLEGHPKVGASFEGFGISQVIERLGVEPEETFFWATHASAELDLLIVRGRRRYGFEFKRTSAPTLGRSMHAAVDDLGLTRLDVIHAGDKTSPMATRIRALALSRLLEDLKPLR